VALIEELETHLASLYPASVEKLLREEVAFFLPRAGGTPAVCGGVKLFGTEYGELKRMYVRPAFRGRGFGKVMLDHLADYARQQGVSLLRLETGIHQREAIGLYERMGFRRIPPIPPYREDPLSRCYERKPASNKRYPRE
jgi:ribosomal protein S18 acetylase RimI-like enzyme